MKIPGDFPGLGSQTSSINIMGFKEALAEVDCFQPFVESYNLLTMA